jgi:hypothetical protein
VDIQDDVTGLLRSGYITELEDGPGIAPRRYEVLRQCSLAEFLGTLDAAMEWLTRQRTSHPPTVAWQK